MMKNRFVTLFISLSVLGVFTYSPHLFSEEPINSLQKALLNFAENEIADFSREEFYQDPSAQGYLKGYFNQIWRSGSLSAVYAKAQKRADEIYKEFETFLQSASSSNIALLYDTLRSEAERVSVTADDAAGKLLSDLKSRCFKLVERYQVERKKKDIENLKDIDTDLLLKVRDMYRLLNGILGQRITYEIEFQRLRKAQSNAISWGATQIDGQDQFFKSLQETYNKDLKHLKEEREALSALPNAHELIAQTIQDIDHALESLVPITTGVFEGLRKSHWNQILAYKNLILARAMDIQVELGISSVPENIARMNIELLRSSAEKLSRESHEEMQAAGIAFNQNALFRATDIDVPFLGPKVLDATLILEDVGGGLSLFAIDIGGDIITGHPLRAGQKVVAAPLSIVAAMKGITDEAGQAHLKQAVLFRLAQLSDSTGGWAGVSNTDVAIETENEIEFLKAIDAYYVSDEHYNPFRTTLGVLLTVATVRVILRPVAFVMRHGTARFYLERIKMQRAQDGMIKGSRRTYTPEEIREMPPKKLLEELGLEHKTGRLSAIDYHAMAETIRAILLDSLKDQGGPSIFMGGDGGALFDRETPYRPKPGRRIEDSPESTVPKSTPVRVRQTEGALVKVGAQEQGAILLPEAEPMPTPNVPKQSRIAPPEEVTPEKPHTMSPDAALSEMPHANAPRISPYPWAGHPLTDDGKETVIIIKRDEKGNIIGARTVRVKKGATEDEIWAELGYRDRRDEIIGLRTNPASDRHASYGMQGNDGTSRSGGTGSLDDDFINTIRNRIHGIIDNRHLDEVRKLTMLATFLQALSQRLAELEAVSGDPGATAVSERIRLFYREIEAEKDALEVQRDLKNLQLPVVVPPAPVPAPTAPEALPTLEQAAADDGTSALTYRGDNPDDRYQHLCNIGEAIREAREFLGMLQRDLAIAVRGESRGNANDQVFISAIERPVKGRLGEKRQQKVVTVLIRLIEERKGIRVLPQAFVNAETIRSELGLNETSKASPEPSPTSYLLPEIEVEAKPTPAPEPAPSATVVNANYIEGFARKISERRADLLTNLPDNRDGILKKLLYIWKLELESHMELSGQNESYWPYLKALLDMPSIVIIFNILLREHGRPSFLMTEETLRNALADSEINKELILEDYRNILGKKGVLDRDIFELIREFYPEAPTVRQRRAVEFYQPIDHWSIAGVYTEGGRKEEGVTIPKQSAPAPEPTSEPESEITPTTETSELSAVPETSEDTVEMAQPPSDDKIKRELMGYLTDLECSLQLGETIDETLFNIDVLAEYLEKEPQWIQNELTSLKEKQYAPHLLGAIAFLLGEPGGESANPALESGGSTTEIPTGPIRGAQLFEELLERISSEELSRIELRIPDRRMGTRNGGEISVRFTAHALTLLKNRGSKICHAIIINLFKGYFGTIRRWGVTSIARVEPMYDSVKAASPDGTPVKVRYNGNNHYRLCGSFHDGDSASILFTHLFSE